MIDHTDLAHAAFDATNLPPPNRTPEDALRYVSVLLSLLPPGEQAGWVKAPAGGSNVAKIPNGTLVRAGRVMYPDGQIVKVMNDVPNGGPQWVAEDVQPALYVPYTGGHTSPGPIPAPDPSPALLLKVQELDAALSAVRLRVMKLEQTGATSERVEAINERLDAVDKAAIKTLPEYEGRNWAGKVRSRPV